MHRKIVDFFFNIYVFNLFTVPETYVSKFFILVRLKCVTNNFLRGEMSE